jgi:Response regulator receiver domain
VTREHLVAILTAAGYDVVAAADGADALLMMSRRPFDLILADIVMPLLDGFKLLEVVRDKRIESPGGLKLDLLTRRVVGAPNCPYRAVNTGLGSRHGSSLPSGRTRSVCWIALRIERQRTGWVRARHAHAALVHTGLIGMDLADPTVYALPARFWSHD